MEKDGAYHVAAVDEGQQVRLSEDYFISTSKANPPEIAIARPAGTIAPARSKRSRSGSMLAR